MTQAVIKTTISATDTVKVRYLTLSLAVNHVLPTMLLSGQPFKVYRRTSGPWIGCDFDFGNREIATLVFEATNAQWLRSGLIKLVVDSPLFIEIQNQLSLVGLGEDQADELFVGLRSGFVRYSLRLYPETSMIDRPVNLLDLMSERSILQRVLGVLLYDSGSAGDDDLYSQIAPVLEIFRQEIATNA